MTKRGILKVYMSYSSFIKQKKIGSVNHIEMVYKLIEKAMITMFSVIHQEVILE